VSRDSHYGRSIGFLCHLASVLLCKPNVSLINTERLAELKKKMHKIIHFGYVDIHISSSAGYYG
jgi:hypothetical protein